MKSKKNATRFFVPLLLLVFALSALEVGAAAKEPEILPAYTGVSSLLASLDISPSGCASCYGYVKTLNGYTANLKVELQKDGNTIKTWTASGSKDFDILKDYWVVSGHDYQVIVSATVKNSNGVIVDTPSIESQIVSF